MTEPAQQTPNVVEPPIGEREYYTHRDGRRGFLVSCDGDDCIKLDTPQYESVVDLDDGWAPLRQTHPVTQMQLAQVSYAADAALCVVLRMPRQKDWIMLRDVERIVWARQGPDTEDPVRLALFASIHNVLAPLARR